MKRKTLASAISVVFLALVLMACGGEQAVEVTKLMASPKAFVGSDTCKMCHLEHYDSWKMTLPTRIKRFSVAHSLVFRVGPTSWIEDPCSKLQGIFDRFESRSSKIYLLTKMSPRRRCFRG